MLVTSAKRGQRLRGELQQMSHISEVIFRYAMIIGTLKF